MDNYPIFLKQLIFDHYVWQRDIGTPMFYLITYCVNRETRNVLKQIEEAA